MIITAPTAQTDGDALFMFDYSKISNNIEIHDVIARIGDDQPISNKNVSQMLEAIGFNLFLEDSEYLTIGQAQNILKQTNWAGKGIYVTEDNDNSLISYALWVDLFIQLLMQHENEIKALSIVPLGNRGNKILTNLGEFELDNMNITAFNEQEIRILHDNRQILAIVGIVSKEPILKNAMVLHTDAFGATILIGGVTRNFIYAENKQPLALNTVIANIKINGKTIIDSYATTNIISGTLERVTEDVIELREWGKLPLCNAFAIYRMTENTPKNEATQGIPQDLLVGVNVADFYVINGRVGAAIVTRKTEPIYIRVAINTSGFNGLSHDSLTISSTGAFTVKGGDRKEIFSKEDEFTVSRQINADLWGNPRLYISTTNPNDKLEVVGLNRNWPNNQNPTYRGVFEIAKHSNGGFILVNELPLEEYLYSVVPSEMPSSFGLGASKVQAVTARSFARHQFYANIFRAYGAHVDDSVLSQVYNNIPENEISINAVRATRGQVLTINGEVIVANYFSTSGGTTANFGEVWASGSQFPSETPTHLRSIHQFSANDHNPGDLRLEKYADIFFRNTTLSGFDQAFPWFRWNVRMTTDELTTRINNGIITRQPANPAMINTLNNSNPIGTLQNIEVIRRGQGGNIMEIKITGTNNTVYVKTEFNIRTLLSPGNIPVTRNNNTQTTHMSLLPSAFFTMEKETDNNGNLTAITFYGGGHGHGVGMSQNGAFALLSQGLTYTEVLKHFYPGAEIQSFK